MESKNHFNVEVFELHITRGDVFLLLIVAISLFTSLGLWITHPGHTPLFAFLQMVIFIIIAASMAVKRWTATILTRDAFIHTQPQRVVPWEDIDRIEVKKRGVTIYYKKKESTKKLTLVIAYENKEQFIESLKSASGAFGFLFEGKTK